MSEEVFDVILQTTGRFHADLQTFLNNPPPENDFFLEEGFWIGSLPNDLQMDAILDACDPAGFNFRPARQFGAHYAFCRRTYPTGADYYAWDHDQRLSIALFASRLVRPTTISACYSARLYFEDGKLRTIVAGPTQGLGAHAWVVAKDNWRDWLSAVELDILRSSLSQYRTNAPERVRHARKHVDGAFHAFYLDQRFASLVTSFESLLKTSEYQATKQFAVRAPNLAEMVDMELDEDEARAVYRDRSAFVHGMPVSFEDLSDDLIEKYNRFESVLRKALLRASTEPEFAAHFETAESVERAFAH